MVWSVLVYLGVIELHSLRLDAQCSFLDGRSPEQRQDDANTRDSITRANETVPLVALVGETVLRMYVFYLGLDGNSPYSDCGVSNCVTHVRILHPSRQISPSPFYNITSCISFPP